MTSSIIIENSFWKGKRVLLTGHTGFKGSWLLQWLLMMESDICGLSLMPESTSLFNIIWPSLNNLPFRHEIADIRDFKRVSECVQDFQPEVVFHFAAQPLVIRSYQDPLGTWSVNVQGTLNLLEALKTLQAKCSVVLITTDKVYENKEWLFGYRENDSLGGYDPYSASKAAAEIAISSWRSSFCGELPHQNPYLRVASARSGNVIGGGDWSNDRIVPDTIKSLQEDKAVRIRNPYSTRPWQHVLEPLHGYLLLAERLYNDSSPPCEAFNFGPLLSSNRSVLCLIKSILSIWPGNLIVEKNKSQLHEAGLLHLQSDKAFHLLSWKPVWDYDTTVQQTIQWYLSFHHGEAADELCTRQISAFAKNTQLNNALFR